MLSNNNKIQNFTFTDHNIHGGIVNITSAYKDLASRDAYPKPVKQILGEMLSAACLIKDAINQIDLILFKIRSKTGGLKYACVEVKNDFEVTGIATLEKEINENATFGECIDNSGLLIIEAFKNNQLVSQCILEIEKQSLQESLEESFFKSLNKHSHFKLIADPETYQTSGMMLMTLPTNKSQEFQELNFENIKTLAQTTTKEEMFSLDFEEILYRLFHEEEVMLYDTKDISFKCSCAKEKILKSIFKIGNLRMSDYINDEGFIECQCNQCAQKYIFTAEEISEFIKKNFDVKYF
jgi:molecular chaperone Hsp33